MRIRHADPARDAPRCAAIYGPFVSRTAISFEDRVPTADDFATRIRHLQRTHPWLVADHEHTVAGFAYASPHRARAAYRWAAEVALYVDPAHHRRGIGQALYTALLDLLRQQGLWIACAGIGLPNDASVALHQSLGFTPVGVYRDIGYKLGRWWDVSWWQLSLQRRSDGPPGEPGPPVVSEPRQPPPPGRLEVMRAMRA